MRKGKFILLLFALPFFGVGVWMAYTIAGSLGAAWQMKQWQPVPATLSRAGYESYSGDDSTTYEAYAEYRYRFGGREYCNDRVAVAGGADNIGDYQTDLGNRLRRTMDRGESIVVYVNPAAPAEAVIDRSVRWGMLGFKSIFLLVFGSVGLGLIIFALRARKTHNLPAQEPGARPWLANDAWQTAVIRSGSRVAMYVTWGFAAFWNLVSAPLPFVVYREVVDKDNTAALAGLLFPLIGIGLIAWAVQRTLEWRRFGPAPVTLDPFPGSIGGHVGGTIDIDLPYDPAARFSLTLTNLYSYVSGSGKNRSRNESPKWQDTQVAHATSGSKGTRLSFRFDLPENLDESDATRSESTYFIWRLNVKAELEGVDIDRDYDIPVYATRQTSAQLSALSIRQARGEQDDADLAAIRKMLRLSYDAGGRAMVFPVGRNLLAGFSGLVFGAIFAGIGWFLVAHEGHPVMGSVFGAVGLLILAAALYSMLNSLEVLQDGGDLRTVRRILGIAVQRRRMRRADFVRFDKKVSSSSQSGGRHVVRYATYAIDRAGQKMIVGEGFRGASQAEAAADFIARQFGLTPREAASVAGERTDESNLLAAD